MKTLSADKILKELEKNNVLDTARWIYDLYEEPKVELGKWLIENKKIRTNEELERYIDNLKSFL